MAYVVDSLTLKLESKISYHTDAKLHYMEIKAMVDELIKENKKLRDENMEYLDKLNRLMDKNNKLEDDYEAIKEQLAPIEEQLETAENKLVAANDELVLAKEELVTAKAELVAAKEELAAAKLGHVAANRENVVAKEELAQKNQEVGVLRKKLQKSEAMYTRLQQQIVSAPGPEPGHSIRVTRSTHKRELLLQGSSLNDADGNCLKKRKSYPQLPIAVQSTSRGDDLEVVGQMLIKGFTDSTDGGRHLGLKETWELNEKPFQDACAMKLPPSHSAARASELYTEWQELINNPEWKPFKTVTVDGNRQEVIDGDDERLQGLKMQWGEGPYDSVVRALVERKEHSCGGTVDIWNYKEGRKATAGEFAEHILDQLKQFRLKTY